MKKTSKKVIGIQLSLIISMVIISNLLYAKNSITISSQVYKNIGNTKLKIHIFSPADLKNNDKRPIFIFFHGGGWVQGTPEWGFSYCKHFASLGMVAFSVEYRLSDQKNITPVENIADAKSAIRWIRIHAKQLGVNTKKLTASGMSAGGHLAACTGILEGFDEKGEDLSISSQVNALVLLSAPVDPTVDPWFINILNNRTDAKELSPTHHIRSGLPPTMIFQGIKDQTVSYLTAKEFTRKMLAEGNACELNLFEGCDHFLNCVDSNEVTSRIDRFLIENKLLTKASKIKRISYKK